jgi:hypothetical protein
MKDNDRRNMPKTCGERSPPGARGLSLLTPRGYLSAGLPASTARPGRVSICVGQPLPQIPNFFGYPILDFWFPGEMLYNKAIMLDNKANLW